MNRRGFLKTTAASALVSLLPLPPVSRASATSSVCISTAPAKVLSAADFEGLGWIEIGEIRSVPGFEPQAQAT
ncbi:twin-arginine translocation signal domain-containing protein [Phaeobacter sp. S60]|uniref:twin-arginine translocation signal domain-containing protein n=1 Tax=Phaeobacter sp. S60 TaxID=1569353 RepID=UPI0015855FD1